MKSFQWNAIGRQRLLSTSELVRLWQSSQEAAISGSCQQAVLGILSSVWIWRLYKGWIPRWGSFWMAFPTVYAPHYVSIFPPMSILFPLLRRTETSTLWSSFFVTFIWSVNFILGILSFWAISTYQCVHTMCVLLWLGYLTQDDILQTHVLKFYKDSNEFRSCIFLYF